MDPQRIRTGLFGGAILLGVVVILLVLRPRLGPVSRGLSALERRAPLSAAALPPVKAAPAAAPLAEEPSRLAEGLNAPDGDVTRDLRIVSQIFSAYRSALRTGNPVGENAEITAALRGRNKLGFEFIPPGVPAVDSKGQLCDRWGTPYFFHQVSGSVMEIRSAGPDHTLWTSDDVVFRP